MTDDDNKGTNDKGDDRTRKTTTPMMTVNVIIRGMTIKLILTWFNNYTLFNLQ